MWTRGSTAVTVTIPLDYRRRYLITGFLTLKEGDNYAHVYISTLCQRGGSDQILCGVRDLNNDNDLGIVEEVTNATRAIIKLRSTGGFQRAEGAIYDLT